MKNLLLSALLLASVPGFAMAEEKPPVPEAGGANKVAEKPDDDILDPKVALSIANQVDALVRSGLKGSTAKHRIISSFDLPRVSAVT